MASVISVISGKTPATFSYNETFFVFHAQHGKRVEVPLQHIIWAEVSGNDIHVRPEHLPQAAPWCEHLLEAAYKGVKRCRRLRVLINPVGGTGHGRSTFERQVQPIFEAAHAKLDTTVTEYGGHARDIAKSMPLDFDAIVAVSGDGIIHEIINGLAQRNDANEAWQIPIAPIPTGSGNGFCINLNGIEHGLMVGAAALNILKGDSMELDLCLITQKDKKIYSFMSQAMGLMADIDLGTEHLRWMGSTRFMYGYMRGAMLFRSCPAAISMKVVEDDKHKMLKMHRAYREPTPAQADASHSEHPSTSASKLSAASEDGWVKFDKQILYIYAGKMPYVSSDLMQFPVSHPSDGYVDVVIQQRSRRSELFTNIPTAARGGQYWVETQNYYKVQAYRVEPTAKGYLSIDGEQYAFEAFEVEVQKGLARTLSTRGRYNVDF